MKLISTLNRSAARLPSSAIFTCRLIVLILLFAFWCLGSSPGATNSEVRTPSKLPPPPPIGSVQWQIDQQNARDRQEQFRQRVVIPSGAVGDISRPNGATPLNAPLKAIEQPVHPQLDAFGLLIKLVCFLVILGITAIMAAKKFAPHWFVTLESPAVERATGERVRTEEEAFQEFITKFRVGPSAKGVLVTPEAEEDPGVAFYALAAGLLSKQHTLLQDLNRDNDMVARHKILTEMYAGICSIKEAAKFPEVLPMWQLASALEGLLKQLTVKMGNVTLSTVRSVIAGVELLDKLCVPGTKPDLFKEGAIKFLVVDDDRISRHALTLALKKAFGQPDVAANGEEALEQAGRNAYDVIFLDVQMPGMDGFELCTKIRESDLNRHAPVVFVTSQSDFDARAKSILSGGNDLMGKPFLIFEVTVKALTHALQARLAKHELAASQKPAEKAMGAKPATSGTHSSPFPAVPRPTSMPAKVEKSKGAEVFPASALSTVGTLRDLCQNLLQTANEESRQGLLAEIFVPLTSVLTQNDAHTLHPAYQLCAALEGLIRKMLGNAKYSTPSAITTVVTAVDLLHDLCAPGLNADLLIDPPVSMLVVDDDLVTRRVMSGALQTFFTRPESVENGEDALAKATEKSFDAIFMDVVMPGMDGFETCQKIRATTFNKSTPVVFVTSRNDFQARSEMSRTGGNDLMEKPFLNAEITVKALTLALRGRLEKI